MTRATGALGTSGGIQHRVSSRCVRDTLLRGSTALVALLVASSAYAQCADPTTRLPAIPDPQNPNQFVVFPNSFGLPISSSVSGVQSLISVLTTQNTAFLTQTSAFIGAPGNPPANIQGGGVWARGIGGTFDTNTSSTFSRDASLLAPALSGSCNVRTFQDYTGFQGGADIARLNIDGMNIHGGVTVGYTDSTVRSNGSFGAQFQTPFVGLYGAVTKGGFFADGQVRWDFFQGQLNDAANLLNNQRLDARSTSFTGNLGYQFSLGDGWFVEPSAGAVYAEVKVDRLQTGGAIFVQSNPSFAFPISVKVQDFDSILGRASLRVGKNVIIDGYTLQPFATASVINEFGGQVRTNITTGFDAVTSQFFGYAPGTFSALDQSAQLTSKRIGTYGQFSVGVAGQVANTGWLGYIRGDYRTGDRVEGYGISGGLRYQFTPETLARPLITKGDSGILPAIDGPVNWTGFSVGGSVGSLWGRTRQDESAFFIDVIGRAEPHVAGIYAGAQVGYDYQFANNIVVGIAGDGGFTNARGGRGCASDGGGYVYNCQANINSIYMATARVGYASERTLYYVKGGAAFANAEQNQVSAFGDSALYIIDNNFPDTRVTSSEQGWTLGAGFEFAITKNVSAKAEYMHYELDRKRYANFGSDENQAFVTTRNRGDLVKIGVNYRFVSDILPAVVSKY